MRVLFFIGLLFFLPIFLVASESPIDAHRNLTGYWVNAKIKETIKIKDRNNSIFINGLPGTRVDVQFDRIYGNVYKDGFGNKLTVENRNTIFIDLGRRHSLRYVKWEENDSRRWGKEEFDKDYDPFDNHHKDEYFSNNFENQRPYDNNNCSASANWNFSYSEIVTGTWASSIRGRENIAILDTREGIKAKVSGTNRWVDYCQNKVIPNEFIDNKGNKMVFERDAAIWIPKDIKDAVIKLQKISSDIRY